jgi:two-component system cell cycle response regulator
MVESQQYDESSGRKRRRPLVLVVDDSAEAQEALRENLEPAGYEVVVAPNGRDALALLADQTAPHLLIVDLLMPVMGGLELVEVLRSYRRLAQIPVLLVSGIDCPDDVRVGRARFLRKPIRCAELLEQVAELLGSRPTTDG